jgi:hypothetical protein
MCPPVAHLREQAELLSKKTGRELVGRVLTSRYQRDFLHRFLIVAPSLDDYSYELLWVRHSAEMYPLSINSEALGGTVECANEEAFLTKLRTVLADDRTKRVIAAIRAQVEPSAV